MCGGEEDFVPLFPLKDCRALRPRLILWGMGYTDADVVCSPRICTTCTMASVLDCSSKERSWSCEIIFYWPSNSGKKQWGTGAGQWFSGILQITSDSQSADWVERMTRKYSAPRYEMHSIPEYSELISATYCLLIKRTKMTGNLTHKICLSSQVKQNQSHFSRKQWYAKCTP